MTLFKNKLLPLLLALLMVVTMLPMTALAAEISEETTTVCTDEHCTHDHAEEISAPDDISAPASVEESPVAEEMAEAETPEAPTPVDTPDVTEKTSETPEVDELPTVETPAPENPEAPEVPAETNAYSGYIGDSAVSWTFNAETGRLFISGSGYAEPFSSENDQPWRELRERITSVRFDLAASMEIIDLCYWFDGCINLSDAAIPVYVFQIAPADFSLCGSLCSLTYGGVDVLAEIKADYSDQPDIELMPEETDNGGISLFSSSNCGVTSCTCKGSCSWGYKNYRVAPESNNYHIMTVYCATCGKTDGIIVSGNHSYSSNGYCSLCGYYNSAYDTSVCYHTSTYTTWSGCNWTRYCRNCGQYISSGTSHGSTYTSWNGCNWYEYCRDCGQLMDSGTSHSYSYGGWEYYNSSQHRRLYSCSSCGQGSYTYGYHSTSTRYAQYSATQHSVSSYCSTCAANISTSYASHNFSYGSWTAYNGTQHRRLKTCSTCGYSEYEYSNHSLSYGSWTNYSASQHQRSVSCSTCGYSGSEYASHSLTSGAWASISDTQHQRTGSCSCGYGTTETGAHTDTDDNGYCDDCEYLMTRFSVTVPASLSLTVSEHGAVYAADNAAIVNNSTGAIAVTGVTVSTTNGWTLVPFSSNMAAAKVDAKHIGFSLNNAQSAVTGTTEHLSLSGAWSIAKGESLPLTYDAVVSAMSQPVSEQVLTVVFVLDWAA